MSRPGQTGTTNLEGSVRCRGSRRTSYVQGTFRLEHLVQVTRDNSVSAPRPPDNVCRRSCARSSLEASQATRDLRQRSQLENWRLRKCTVPISFWTMAEDNNPAFGRTEAGMLDNAADVIVTL